MDSRAQYHSPTRSKSTSDSMSSSSLSRQPATSNFSVPHSTPPRPRRSPGPKSSPLSSSSASKLYYSRLSSPSKRRHAGTTTARSGNRAVGDLSGSASKKRGSTSRPSVPKFSLDGDPRKLYSDRLIPSRADSHLSGARFFESFENESNASNRMDTSSSQTNDSAVAPSNNTSVAGGGLVSSLSRSRVRESPMRSLPVSHATSTSSMRMANSLLMGLSQRKKPGDSDSLNSTTRRARNPDSDSHSTRSRGCSRSGSSIRSSESGSSFGGPGLSGRGGSDGTCSGGDAQNSFSPRVLRFHSPKKKRARFNPPTSSPSTVTASPAAAGSSSSRGRAAAARSRLSQSMGDLGEQTSLFSSRRNNLLVGSDMDPFALHPVDHPHCRRMFSSPRRPHRKIPKNPFKVLDAPALKDDFYLNLIDWSAENVLAVGLKSTVYLWSACTSKVTELCQLPEDDSVTSVAWMDSGSQLAVGTEKGGVQIWDTVKKECIRELSDHKFRVGSLAWSNNMLASGSRDRSVRLRDPRNPQDEAIRLQAHVQEVCGLKWSYCEDKQLASGGNDNKLLIWSARKSNQPVLTYTEHSAAVKAIAWSPHQSGLLASGGGTTDRCIRFWNTLSAKETPINRVDTGSQVCNLGWSKNVDEIISTHGYSLNQIIIWKYASMEKVVTLTGHTMRVLYLAVSPDGQTVVTGAGDETLRFWTIFPGSKANATTSSGIRPSFRDIDHIR